MRAVILLVAVLLPFACSPATEEAPAPPAPALAEAPTRFAPPAAAGALAPHLTASGGAVLLTWLEPAAAAELGGDTPGHHFRLARFSGGTWSEPVTIASGSDFFANWADTPTLAANARGELLASWLEKTGESTYAYGIRLARSTDGRTWQPLGFLHDDATPTEHGFVSLLPAGDGFQAFWLDGRQMLEEGPMTLRTARVEEGAVGPSEVLDERVCDCCQTAATMLPEGAVVAYRDRSPEEVRDVFVLRQTGEGWSDGTPVHEDSWVFPACPVNGPAVAADGSRVALAWFTAADDTPRVLVAFSDDGGASFAEPIEIDRERVLGRVGLALDGEGEAIVTWLAAEEGQGRVYLNRILPGGPAGAPLLVAETSPTRSSGVPRVLRSGDDLYLAWVEAGEEGGDSRLRFAVLPLAGVPAAAG